MSEREDVEALAELLWPGRNAEGRTMLRWQWCGCTRPPNLNNTAAWSHDEHCPLLRGLAAHVRARMAEAWDEGRDTERADRVLLDVYPDLGHRINPHRAAPRAAARDGSTPA